ncbi:NADPH-dependent FMN reductase [Catenulispora acidiphila DSM 44928]|uniref:NADPH-dependent FMN reductase n=1 Tax=Catenulispora acidiphila (strain DSM 44928 / JCM 14897 / NBRC 102108 / NRRL B-24433 / ID139908) TaxID=479433 RepID=C7PZF1_CATAD|nr:NAD(P)H-dependent oxidoreductase [Catenulispora acidiphila]ACU71608.1 NADPH-dependent FMN reductase [Catenulispora acidiphila DSM 44928]
MAKVTIIVASTRPSRIGHLIGDWVKQETEAFKGFDDVELVDLAVLNLPFMNEPHHPRLKRYVHQHTLDWSATVAAADAFLFVMPEYNYGYNAELKNAIDYLHQEWQYKPVGLVSYGGVAGGTRAAQMIKQVVTTLKMTPIFEAVPIPFVHQFITEQGTFQPNDIMTTALAATLEELLRVSEALRPLRQTPSE